MHVRSRTQIPAFVNPLAGNAPLARAVLRDSGRFEIEDVTPDALANRVRSVVKEGATRVLVAGGDGRVMAVRPLPM